MSLDKIKIQKTAQSLIGQFDPKAKVDLDLRDNVWCVEVESEDSPLLIGRYGQNLHALEHLLRLVLAKQAAEFLAINLDIAGYKAARNEQIVDTARMLAQKTLETGETQELPAMNAYERRLAHMALAEIEGIETESVGVEPERRIVIKITKISN